MSKNAYFSKFIFFKQYKPAFYDILERKNGLLGYKNKKSNKSKNWLFSKGVNPWFRSFFQLFFLGNIGQENILYDIPERKNAFLGYKNRKFKRRKFDIFPKGLTHGFGPKMAISQPFCFIQ